MNLYTTVSVQSSIIVLFMALIEFFYKIFQLIYVKLEVFNQNVFLRGQFVTLK